MSELLLYNYFTTLFRHNMSSCMSLLVGTVGENIIATIKMRN